MTDTENATPASQPAAPDPPPAVQTAEPPRENMITTAVRFLQNPKVQQSPVAQRRAFLEKKGLSKEEIDIALERSGTAHTVQAVSQSVAHPMSQSVAPMSGALQQPQVIVAPVSTFSRVKDYVAYFIIASGATYGIYQLVRKYLLPYLYGPTARDDRLAKVESSVQELQQSLTDTMTKLQDTLTTLHELVNSQTDSMKVISDQIAAQRGPYAMAHIQDSQFTNEIKDEIKSLKGLLLSRKQFPPTPATTPVLPAWQRQLPAPDETKKDAKETPLVATEEQKTDSTSSTETENSAAGSPETGLSVTAPPVAEQRTKTVTEYRNDEPVLLTNGDAPSNPVSDNEQSGETKEIERMKKQTTEVNDGLSSVQPTDMVDGVAA